MQQGTRKTANTYREIAYAFAAIALGLALGRAVPAARAVFEALLWPALAFLLYATFLQIPLLRLLDGLRDLRFLSALLFGNFVVIPPIVALMLALLPADPAIRLGVLLVLLVPCTDWFLTFTHLGGGDLGRALVATPLLLIVQLLLLPVFLALFAAGSEIGGPALDQVALAFATIVLVPLALAFWSERHKRARALLGRAGASFARLPEALLALVLFLIAASQAEAAAAALFLSLPALVLFLAYLAVALALGVVLTRLWRLPARSGRALVFSFGTRNSFVVLPLALALPEPLLEAAVVIVLQSFVELIGMLVYIRIVPRLLPDEEGVKQF